MGQLTYRGVALEGFDCGPALCRALGCLFMLADDFADRKQAMRVDGKHAFCPEHYAQLEPREPEGEVVSTRAGGLTTAQENDIITRFSYHPPTPEQIPVYDEIRSRVRTLAFYLVGVTPVSREQSRMLSALEDVMFNANAAVARGGATK